MCVADTRQPGSATLGVRGVCKKHMSVKTHVCHRNTNVVTQNCRPQSLGPGTQTSARPFYRGLVGLFLTAVPLLRVRACVLQIPGSLGQQKWECFALCV